jgi:molybdopterin-guanine dinucleotide biosynthesis adapter protein
MKLFGLAGWSGSGKTTLLTALVPVLIRRGLRVSTLKHVHHSVDLDRPGKDTHRHRLAGATEVALVSGSRWTLMHELRGEAEPGPADLLRHMTPVDLVLIEGFKHGAHDKLEVHRPAVGKPLLCRDDPHIVAVASDEMLADLPVPLLRLDDAETIAAFIIRRCGLRGSPVPEAQ